MNEWRHPVIDPQQPLSAHAWPDMGLSIQQRLSHLPETSNDRAWVDALEDSNCMPIPNDLALHIHIPDEHRTGLSYQKWAPVMMEHLKRLAQAIDNDRQVKQLNIYIEPPQPTSLLIAHLIHRIEAYFSVADDALANISLSIQSATPVLTMASDTFGRFHIDYAIADPSDLPDRLPVTETAKKVTTGITVSPNLTNDLSSDHIHDWLFKLINLMPTRISFESLSQTGTPYRNILLSMSDPLAVLDQLKASGYHMIGTGVFAQSSCPLASAFHEGDLGLGLDGYAQVPELDHLGVGLGAVSRASDYMTINHKSSERYLQALKQHHLPIAQGGHLNQTEQIREAILTELICQFRLSLDALQSRFLFCFKQTFPDEHAMLQHWVSTGLLTVRNKGFDVTDLGLGQLPRILAPFARPLLGTNKKFW